MTTRTALAVRCAPLGKVHHLLVDALPPGWTVATFGPDGALAQTVNAGTSIIVSRADFDGVEWCHASIAHPHRMPDYADLVMLHRWVYGDGHAYQVFVPPSEHVNIHEHALHLWGRADGAPCLPHFGAFGTI